MNLHRNPVCRRLLAVTALLMLALGAAAAAPPRPAPAPQRVTIMPLGDSITEGGSSFVCYRYPLWEKLFAGGYLFDFVGSKSAPTRIGPLAHEGYGGRNAEFLAANIERLYKAHPADIVLVHAGHNHFVEEKPAGKILAATESIIRTIRSIRPDAVILLAQVIPSGKLPKYAYIPELNRDLSKLAARLDSPRQRVIPVDQASGFDWRRDTVADHVHPNARGGEKMAAKWYAALVKVLPPPSQTFHPELKTYKKVGQAELKLHVFRPEGAARGEARPAMVFFFGGGWVNGTPLQYYRECSWLAGRGMVAIAADYRIKSVNGSTPFDSLQDAKSAIRWVRAHAAELGVDPQRIVAAGSSAGGHLAAATAIDPGFDDPREDARVSSRPNALVLWYPVIDNGPGGYGDAAVKARYKEFSPLHAMKSSVPPTLFLLGTRDPLVPVATAERFKRRIEELGGRCDLHLFPGCGHPMYPYREGMTPLMREALAQVDKFLVSLNYLH